MYPYGIPDHEVRSLALKNTLTSGLLRKLSGFRPARVAPVGEAKSPHKIGNTIEGLNVKVLVSNKISQKQSK